MKKFSLVICMVILAQLVQGQDTVVYNSGIKALIIYVGATPTEIKYRNWYDPDSPIREIRKDLVATIKFAQRIATPLDEKSFVAHGGEDAFGISGNEVTKHIDSLFFSISDIQEKQESIISYVNSLPQWISRKSLQKYYQRRYEESIKKSIEIYILQDGETYLFIGGEDGMLDVLTVIVNLYANKDEEDNVIKWLDFLNHYSSENDNIFDADVERLQKETQSILHNFERDIPGLWVMLNPVSEKITSRVSPLILKVNDVTMETGANIYEPTYEPKKRKGVFYNQINTSQGLFFNGNTNYAEFQFASETIKDRRAWSNMIHTVLDNTQKTSVEMTATIRTSDASLEKKLQYEVAVALTTATINALVSDLNTSSKTTDVYNVSVFQNTPKVMNALVSYVSIETITPSSANEDPLQKCKEWVEDKKSYMVKWEKDDRVFFVATNGKLINPYEIHEDDPVMADYRYARNRYSLRNPAYLIPFLGCTALGGGFLINGVKILKKIDNSVIQHEEIDKKEEFKGLARTLGGFFFTVISLSTIRDIMKEKRSVAYDEINRKNLAKLRKKASATLSMSPTYFPENNTLGAAVNLSF